MITKHIFLKGFVRFVFLFILGLSTAACTGVSKYNDANTHWQEEAQLHDGSKIIVSRSVIRGGRSELGQKPSFYSQALSFVIPTTNEKVTWQDNFSEDIGGANFLPMMLEIDQGIPYLVVNPLGCLSYNKWGRPNPSYVIFKYHNKTWNRISLQELPESFQTPNLIFSSPDEEAKKSGQFVVSAETIRALYARYRQPEYKTILRHPLQSGGGIKSCPDYNSGQYRSFKAPIPKSN